MTKVLIILTLFITVILIYCNTSNNNTTVIDYMAAGDSITKQTFDTLNKTLQRAMGNKNLPEAIEICNSKAMGLTATYGRDDIIIARTSLRLRNKANAPSSNDYVQLEYFKKLAENGEPLQAKLVAEHTGVVHYYKPIIIQPQCLSCHGKVGVDIEEQTLKAIKTKYPEDEATDYANGDLRGLWHLTFNVNTKKNKR